MDIGSLKVHFRILLGRRLANLILVRNGWKRRTDFEILPLSTDCFKQASRIV